MVYLVLIHIPLTEQENLPKIIKWLQNEYNSENVTISETKTHYEISCRVSPTNLSDVLEKMESMGVGVEYGVLDVIELTTSIPNVKEAKKKRRFSTTGLPLRMIRSTIANGSGLSVDFCLYLIVAASLSGIGLATDNSVTIVAAMLISPMMTPICGLCFGVLMNDWRLILKSLVTECVGIVLCLLMGILVAFCTVPMVGVHAQTSFTTQFQWPNGQMIGRGTPEALFTGLFVAIPSGVGVPLSLVAGNINSLIGVAISAALLPPVVCSGMNLVFGSLGPFLNSDIEWSNAHAALKIAGYSFALFVENTVVIIICSIFVLKLKNVKPLRKASRWYQSLPTVPPPGLSLIPRSFTVYQLNEHAKNRDTKTEADLKELKMQSMEAASDENHSPAVQESILDKVPYLDEAVDEIIDNLEAEDTQQPVFSSPEMTENSPLLNPTAAASMQYDAQDAQQDKVANAI